MLSPSKNVIPSGAASEANRIRSKERTSFLLVTRYALLVTTFIVIGSKTGATVLSSPRAKSKELQE